MRDGVELVPNLTHIVEPRSEAVLLLRGLRSGAGQRRAGASARASPSTAERSRCSRRRSSSARRSTPRIGTPPSSSSRCPAGSFKPGLYTCQVNIIDEVSGRFAFPRFQDVQSADPPFLLRFRSRTSWSPTLFLTVPGTFCWPELSATTDQKGATSFYGALFGWEVVDMPMGPAGVYTTFKLRGEGVGAACSLRPRPASAGRAAALGLGRLGDERGRDGRARDIARRDRAGARLRRDGRGAHGRAEGSRPAPSFRSGRRRRTQARRS